MIHGGDIDGFILIYVIHRKREVSRREIWHSKGNAWLHSYNAWDEMNQIRFKRILYRHKREEELREAELSKGLVSCSLPSWFKMNWNQRLPVVCRKPGPLVFGIKKKKKKGEKAKKRMRRKEEKIIIYKV